VGYLFILVFILLIGLYVLNLFAMDVSSFVFYKIPFCFEKYLSLNQNPERG